jgi:hypothetical protein
LGANVRYKKPKVRVWAPVEWIPYEDENGITEECVSTRSILSFDRREQVMEGRKPLCYAVAVETHRLYGGPEAGGWYYDRSYVVEAFAAVDYRSLLAAVRVLCEDHPTNRYGRHSAASSRHDVTIYLVYDKAHIDQFDESDEPTPRYE